MSELPLGLNSIVITPWVGCQKAVSISWVTDGSSQGIHTDWCIKPNLYLIRKFSGRVNTGSMTTQSLIGCPIAIIVGLGTAVTMVIRSTLTSKTQSHKHFMYVLKTFTDHSLLMPSHILCRIINVCRKKYCTSKMFAAPLFCWFVHSGLSKIFSQT